MSQIQNGLRLGNGFSLLFGTADPNSAAAGPDTQGAGLDWCYFRLGTGSPNTWLYRCSTAAVIVNGVVTQRAIWTAK